MKSLLRRSGWQSSWRKQQAAGTHLLELLVPCGIADSSEYVSFINPQFSTLTEDHPGVVLIGFGVVAVYIKYYHVQVRVLESTQEIHQHLAGFTAGVRTEVWKMLGEHMANMATKY